VEVSTPTYEKNKLLIDGLECINSNIGIPHLLVEVDNVDKFDLEPFVKKVYETKEFEKGVNVEIFNLFDKKIINARVYGGGVGETDACGSGAVCMFYYLYNPKKVNHYSFIFSPRPPYCK
jgi:Diaminopimelate epimerase